MHKKILLVVVFLLLNCFNKGDLKPFKSDGCSLFPDRNIITNLDWCECCFEHDISYWQGGTEEQREEADRALKNCVLEKTGDENLAELMFRGVRFGGSTHFPNWYRWGYGWEYSRKYKPLSSEEEKMVDAMLKLYYSENRSTVCD